MHVRFRVRTRRGGEVEAESLEALSSRIDAGEVGPDDLIHDALTGEWAPARAHPVYRLLTDPLVTTHDAPAAPVDAGAGAEADAGDASMADGSVLGPPSTEPTPAAAPTADGFALAPPPVEPTPAEAAAAFVLEMEEERRLDADRPPALDELEQVDGGGTMFAGLTRRTPDPEAAEPTKLEPPKPAPREPAGAEASPLPRTLGPSRAAREQRLTLWFVSGIGILGAALLAPAWTMDPSTPEKPAAASTESRPALRARPVVATEAGRRARARAGLTAHAEVLAYDLGLQSIPDVWLDGTYLAHARRYPEVRDAWSKVPEYVGALRASESAAYRLAYLAELDAEGMRGATRSLRLASAMADFERGAREREVHRARVEELAQAALSLHDLLLELGDAVRYEPARGTRLSADPVLEAVGRDAEVQAALHKALDRVVAALDPDQGGPGEIQRVTRWVVDGPP